MLRVLSLSALLAVALSHDSSSESHGNVEGKRGHCPSASSNTSVSACTTPCPVGTNCTNVNCSFDTNCTGVQKCCQTNCGLICVDPEYICSDDDDCAGTLICLKKRCVKVYVNPKPVIPLKKKGKEWKGK